MYHEGILTHSRSITRPSSAMPHRQGLIPSSSCQVDASASMADILGVFIKKFSLYEPVLAKLFNTMDPTHKGVYEDQFMSALDRIRVYFSDGDKYKLAECLFPTPETTLDTDRLLALMRRTSGPFSRPQSAKDMRDAVGIQIRRRQRNSFKNDTFDPNVAVNALHIEEDRGHTSFTSTCPHEGRSADVVDDGQAEYAQPQTSPPPSEISEHGPLAFDAIPTHPVQEAAAAPPSTGESSMSGILNHRENLGTAPKCGAAVVVGSEEDSVTPHARPAHLRRGAGLSVRARSAKRTAGYGAGVEGWRQQANPIAMDSAVPTPDVPSSHTVSSPGGVVAEPQPNTTPSVPLYPVTYSTDARDESVGVGMAARSGCSVRGGEEAVEQGPKQQHRFRVLSRRVAPPGAPSSSSSSSGRGGVPPPVPSQGYAPPPTGGRAGVMEEVNALRGAMPVGLSSSSSSHSTGRRRCGGGGGGGASLVLGGAPFGVDTGYNGGGRACSVVSSGGRSVSSNRRASSRTSSAMQMATGYWNRQEREELKRGYASSRTRFGVGF